MEFFIGSSGRNINEEKSHIRVDLKWQSYLRPHAKEQFIRINEYLQTRRKSGTLSRSQITTMSESNVTDQVAAKEISEQHLISGFLRRSDGNQWFWEGTWESVDIQRLDEIREAGEYEWHPLNYSGSPNTVKNVMVEDANVVLLRNIFDWSRSDGFAWGQQIVWSGNFENCQRILQLLEENSNTPNSVKLVSESYNLNTQLRKRYITHHSNHPVLATIAALYCCEKVDISPERTGDGESDSLSCAICHEVFSTEKPGIKLRCNHPFHPGCIFRWFVRRLSCPVCRDEWK